MRALGILLVALGAGFLLNLNDHLIYKILTSVYFLASGYTLSRTLLALPTFQSLLLAPLFVSLPLFIAGAGIYFFYKIDTFSTLFLLCIPLLSIGVTRIFLRTDCANSIALNEADNTFQISSVFRTILFGIFFLSLASFWYILLHSQTIQAILGPWQAMRQPIIIPYMLAGLALLGIFLSQTSLTFSLFLLCVFSFSGFSVLLAVFPLGFGFDPHLHQATERIIAEKGLILPKQFYYLGQYAFVAFFSKLFAISVQTIDRMFIPILSALSIPLAALTCASVYGFSKKFALFFAFFSLLVPFGYATLTVPWNIASLFTLVFSFFSIAYIRLKYKGILIFLALLSLGALSIHPLAGLPLLGVFFCILGHEFLKNQKKKTFIISGIAILSSISIPLALLINSRTSSQLSISLDLPSFQGIKQLFNILSVHINTRFSAPLDFIHIVYQNSGIILLILAVCGIVITVWKISFSWKEALFPIFGAGVCIINFLILEEFFSFPSLISYEQHAYTNRILSLALFFLIPPALISLVVFCKKILYHPLPLAKIAWFLIYIGMLGGSFYLAYPSNDVYRPFHGWNISRADIEAVRTIQKDATGEPYIVLSNQVVAAAAIKEYGFQMYFNVHDEQGVVHQYFYYPVPTSSPLYQFFLDMEAYPSEKIMHTAMQLFGVKRAYFVLTNYEDRYITLMDRAQQSADMSWRISGGADTVLRYVLK